MDTTLRDPYVGRVLDGRYVVESRIARGGMATVYLGVDDRLDREVALKIMHSHLADDPTFVSRFHREARSAARLSHPNVVQVFDQGSDGPVLYLAMEYLPGRTLREMLHQRGALTPRQTLSVMEPVLDALGAAHRSGIVHRDIKPENVILTDDGRVKVADFGLARAASTATSSSGVLLGTVAYLAPELVARGIADARADVYAAGIMLFEMLTGRQPFTGEMPAQIAFRHVHEDVPAPSDLLPYLPGELDDLTRIATARDPDARPADAAAMLGMVRGVHLHLPPHVLDRVPEGSNPGPFLPGQVGGEDRTQVMAASPGAPPGAGHPDQSDTLIGHELIPADDMIGRPGTTADGAAAGRARRSDRPGRGPQSYWWSVLLLAFFALGLALWWNKAGPGAFETMPDVRNLAVAEAQQQLTAAGYTVTTSDSHDDTIASGNVIDTEPHAGDGVRKGSEVTLVVSLGPQLAVVPGVANSSVEDAEQALEELGFSVASTKQRYSASVAEGAVIGTDPKADEQVRVDTPITLIVSKGPKPIKVPGVVGHTRDAAEKTITDLGLTVSVEERFDDTVPAGEVISQEPDSGTLMAGETVSLVISQGPSLVEVPRVTDMRPEEARRVLLEAGFEVELQGTRLLGRVWQQDPAAGSQAPLGSTVTITTF